MYLKIPGLGQGGYGFFGLICLTGFFGLDTWNLNI